MSDIIEGWDRIARYLLQKYNFNRSYSQLKRYDKQVPLKIQRVTFFKRSKPRVLPEDLDRWYQLIMGI